ncbi:MAG TPA: hypothetical protein VF721_21530 [Pyrinomonadaceae bacterium]
MPTQLAKNRKERQSKLIDIFSFSDNGLSWNIEDILQHKEKNKAKKTRQKVKGKRQK